MFEIVKKVKRYIREKTLYMEILGDNKVAYRVLSVKMMIYGDEIITYGIEIVDKKSGNTECISDFSRNIEDAVAFVESLITNKSRPRQLYNRALDYLRVSI